MWIESMIESGYSVFWRDRDYKVTWSEDYQRYVVASLIDGNQAPLYIGDVLAFDEREFFCI